MLVGLTGGIGSGKSSACNIFKSLGAAVISADQIVHDLWEQPELQNKLQAQFNTLDRSEIRKLVFANEHQRHQLEQLLHPLVKAEITKLTSTISSPYCIVEIPLLFEANWLDLVDRTLTIDCSKDLQLARAASRDNCQSAEIEAIINAQCTRAQRLAGSDDVIDNSGTLQELEHLVTSQHKFYLRITDTTK